MTKPVFQTSEICEVAQILKSNAGKNIHTTALFNSEAACSPNFPEARLRYPKKIIKNIGSTMEKISSIGCITLSYFLIHLI